jgi:hypothetical protein
MVGVNAGVSVPQSRHPPEDSGPLVTRQSARSWHLGWRWGALGVAGSVLMTISAPRLVDTGTANWWFLINFPPDRMANLVAFYAGLVALAAAWFGIGHRLKAEPGTRPWELWVLGALWCAPLVASPALFSYDMYSYLAQGTILHLGLDPYKATPMVLVHLGRRGVLHAVSPFWRRTTAPYGPLFLGLVSLIVGVSGTNLVAGIVLVRLIEVAGWVLLAVFVPRLARDLGADACRATWLVAISPLAIMELVGAGHNDALMVGLMVAGVTLARERHPLFGIALCALATMIKVPAAVAIVFILFSWVRTLPRRSAKVTFTLAAVAITAGVVAAVSACTGLGLKWISAAVLSAPGKVHLAITPVTAFGWTIARIINSAGVSLSANHLESAFSVVALGVTALLAVVLLWRADFDRFVPYIGVVLIAAALAGPAAWPWYFCWGLALLGTWPSVQRNRVLPACIAAAVLLVKPDGILVLPLKSAPVVVAFYAAVSAAALSRAHHRNERGALAVETVQGEGPPMSPKSP